VTKARQGSERNGADQADVVICGGGPVGAALALALHAGGRSCRILDARPGGKHDATAFDPRTLALSYGSRLILERLGVWNSLSVTPISSIHVSQQGSFGRTVIDAAEEGVPALGYLIGYSELDSGLRAALQGRVELEATASASRIEAGPDRAAVTWTKDGKPQVASALLVAIADGGTSSADEDARISHDYAQTAIVADVTPRIPHRNRAWERFSASGPIALLPKQRDYAMVWSVNPEDADSLVSASSADFLAKLDAATAGKTGGFAAVGPRILFPLSLRYYRKTTGERTVAIGNAAQTLHPVAGQGFNLGLRDAWALAQALDGSSDCGSPFVLAAYAASRRIDRIGTIRFTDLLARVFTVDSAVMRAGRGAALTWFDLVPPARRFLARRMIFGASAWP
jgi:2-octaprenyl-6-methoxyphenol hydroxylase